MEKKKYYLVSAEALPEVFIKVAEAKRMLQVGEADTVGEAARLVGISRSAQCQQKRQQPYQRVAQYQPARSRHSRPPEQTQYLFPPPLHRRTSLSQNFYKIFLVFFALP